MKKILVTGATGKIGLQTIEHLIKKGVPTSQIIGLARSEEKAQALSALGIEVRLGDYFDYDSLVRAFEGVEKVMLTSAVSFTDRFKQHFNAITAAREAGVQHIVFMSIMRKAGSARRIEPDITTSDIFTEQLLKASGLKYTIVFHPPFIDLLSFHYGLQPYEKGIHIPVINNGKVAAATRDELAEVHAAILATDGHENKIYSLGGSDAISFAQMASTLSEIKGQYVDFTSIPAKEHTANRLAEGLPLGVAEFMTNWIQAIDEGEFSEQSGDMERLLGRKTTTFKQYVLSSQSNLV